MSNQEIPFASIIIPCHNAEHFVGDAIRSAIAQTWQRFEVIVINDGSTDSSVAEVEKFGSQVRLISTLNQGGGAARNLGVQSARGEYIQFLDSDDVLLPKCLELKLLAAKAKPQQVPVSGWERTIEDAAAATISPGFSDSGDQVIELLAGVMQTSAPLHTKSALLAVGGFDPTLPCSQERDLHLRLACYGFRFSRMPETLHIVRRRPGSVSADYGRVLKQHHRIFTRAVEILESQNELTDARRLQFSKVLSSDARKLFHLGFSEHAAECWISAQRLDPRGVRGSYSNKFAGLLAGLLGPRVVETLLNATRRTARKLPK